MKKPFQVVLSIFLSVLFLAACNTAEEPETKTSSDNTTVNEQDQKQTKEEPKNSNTTVEQPVANESDKTSITYSSNGESKTEKTSIVDSEKYSLQVLPGFTLTAEEPGKDLLFFEENDAISMRIEPISKNDSTYNDVIANTEELMVAITEDYEPFDLTPYLEANSNIKNSTAYVANFEDEKVVAVVFENEDLLVRLTIFDDNTNNLSEALIKMGLTVEAK